MSYYGDPAVVVKNNTDLLSKLEESAGICKNYCYIKCIIYTDL